MIGISLDELAAIEPKSVTRNEAIDILVEDFGVDRHRFDGLPTKCVEIRLRLELNRRESNSGLKLVVLEDVVDITRKPELIGAAS